MRAACACPAPRAGPAESSPAAAPSASTLTMDIFATACEARVCGMPADIDGVSFWPTLLGQTEPEPKRDLYFVRREGGAAYGGKTIEAFRRGDWKLLQDSPFAPLELYDLKADPQETTDLAAKERQIFQPASAALRKQIQRGGQTPWQPPAEDPMKESAGAPAPEPGPAAPEKATRVSMATRCIAT